MANRERNNRHPGWMTSWKERLAYAVGFNGTIGESAMLGYLTTYLLMSGIDIASTGVMLLVLKTIDAVDDMLFGWIIDRVHPERNPFLRRITGDGRFMPWLRLCFYVMPLSIILLFNIPSSAPTAVKMAWVCVFYILSDLGYTLLDVPMNAVLTTMTSDTHERDQIIFMRNIGLSLMAIVVNIGLSVLTSAEVGLSISATVTGLSVVMVACMLPMILNVHEHAMRSEERVENEAPRLNILQALRCVITNRNLMSYYIGDLLMNCFATTSIMATFASYYLFGSTLFSMVITIVPMVVGLVIIAIVPALAERYDKNRLRKICLVISLVTAPIVYLAGYHNFVLYLVLYVVNMVPTRLAVGLGTFLTPELVEYGKYTQQKDATSISFAFGTFSSKFPSAIANALSLWVLAACGWQTIEAESFAEIAALNIVQPASAVQGLWALTAGVPIIGIALCLVCCLLYNLNDKDAEIMARCNAGEISRVEADQLLSKQY